MQGDGAEDLVCVFQWVSLVGWCGCMQTIAGLHTRIGNQYGWTTGGPYDGNEWRKYHVVPRAHPLRPLVCISLIGLETKRLLDLQGRRGITSVVRWNLRPVIFGVE